MRYQPEDRYRSEDNGPRWRPRFKVGATSIVVIVVAIGALIAGFIELNSYSRTDGGTVMVIRNGGPLDNTKIRQVLPINSSRERTGWFSDEHPYYAQGRYYNVTGNPKNPQDTSPDPGGTVNVWLKTRDGVNVGAVGQFQFTLDTNLARTYDPINPFTAVADDPATPQVESYTPNLLPRDKGGASLIEIMDNKFGTRTFPLNDDPNTEDKESGEKAPWDGPEGWLAFLDSQAHPQMLGAFNQVMGGTRCVEINPACALVTQATQAEQDAAAAAAAAGQTAPGENTALLRRFEGEIADSLLVNMTRNMGGPFFSHITFSATKFVLDPEVDKRITQTQSKYAERAAAVAQGQKDQADAQARATVAATDANARLAVANTDAAANKVKQDGYNSCQACADQDMQRLRNEGIANLPKGVTTLAGTGADVLLSR